MAATSACAVGSLVAATEFTALAITRFSFTTNAPNGPPRPERTFSTAKSMAFRIQRSLSLAINERDSAFFL